MTTQHTHHEHNDVDQSVVEYPSASETTTANSTSPSPEIQDEVSTPSSDSVQSVAEQAEPHSDSLTDQDNTVASPEEPSTSNPSTTQNQELSQHPVQTDIAKQADSTTDTAATAEATTPNSTVAYEDEIVQTEAETAPSVRDEPQIQVHHNEDTGSTASAAVETQQSSHNVDDSNSTPVELEAGIPAPLEVEQEQSSAIVIAQIDIQPSEQNTPSESVSELIGQEQASALEKAQDETQSTPHEEKLAGAEQKRDTHEAGISVEPIQAEVQQSSEISAPTEEAQTRTGVENAPLPTTQATTQQTEQSLPYTEIAPLINAKAEEVRPFTEFIEEFRLAEAARLQSALQETQVEAFALLNSVEDPSREASITLENVEGTEKTEGTYMQAEANQPANTEAKDTPAAEQKAPIDPANRPVSPLLRPATRLRVPRHGLTRHQREEQQASDLASANAQKTQTETQEAKASTIPALASEPVSPKPARRYRFDRPAANAKSTPTSLSSTVATPNLNGTLPATALNAMAKVAPVQVEDTREAATINGARLEAPAQAQEAIPEVKVPIEPAITTAPASTSEQGRRRHTHKEQAAPTPAVAVEIPTPLVEAVIHADDIAPEDLPPLEYSELQKANNSRRRRRHRSGPSSPIATSAIPATSSEPVVPLASIPPMPQMPAPLQPPATAPAAYQNTATNNPYNIVSGYTLNQMNQGNEIVGPFMGPEPSPARGSVITRDGRTTRAESQRSPVIPPAPSFGSRPAEHTVHGPSAASMAHFANVISQAIQTQTDRTVAELRRANQAPTNVSVSLPPFPSTERVGVFVDVANLLYSARTLRIAVDFGKLLDFLRGNRRLIRAHAYCPTSPQPGDEQMFLQAVKGLGYRITTKNYKTFSSGAKKADLDLDLCMDVVRLVDGGAVDCIVLVSGDSDFMPMLDYCSDHGVRVEVAAFDEAMSATLRQSCDLFVNLSMLEEIRA